MLIEHREIIVESSLVQADMWDVYVPDGRNRSFWGTVATADLAEATSNGVEIHDRLTGQPWAA